MSHVLQAALAWREAGVSTVPILPNATKRPAVRWSDYQAKAPELGQVDLWWRNGSEYGLALICGAVSGNLEMLELEGRVTDSEHLTKLADQLAAMGLTELWDHLNGPLGYSEWSPSGGLHLLYRISDHAVPGNTKIAQDEKRGSVAETLAETRGEGGYVIVAPTGGLCHPTGESWVKLHGQFGSLPSITWEQRCQLHEAIRIALDRRPLTPVPPPSSAVAPRDPRSGGGLSPGDDFEARTDWADILEPHGWQLESWQGRERMWTRPDKDRRDGASATTGFKGDRDRLYVFSTSTIFDAETPYTKFGAYALLNFGGDHRRAAQELVRHGFGIRDELASGLPYVSGSTHVGQHLDGDGSLPTLAEPAQTVNSPAFSYDEVGNAERLWHRVEDRFHYVAEEKRWVRWDGKVWGHDFDGSLAREMMAMTQAMAQTARETGDEALAKWAKASRSKGRMDSTISLMACLAGVTKRASDLDQDRHLVNCDNGTLNLITGQLFDHDPRQLITRKFGASYDPNATCPNFEQFMADVLPDQAVRDYVQRCLGYTLLGDADQRAMFLVHGPSGTGKSQFIEIIRYLFGQYSATAPAGTFKFHRDRSGPNNDLHALRGKRFVATSETADNAVFDEDLIKRITGRDQISSRDLYQTFQEWTPECSVWIATNHPPRFNSDDDAIWRRAKLVPFLTQFGVTGGRQEIPDIARRVLLAELPGIFNWVLAGLAAYQQRGLAEPEVIVAASGEHRSQSDPVMRFIDDMTADGKLAVEPSRTISAFELAGMYDAWCRSSGSYRLRSERVAQRLQSSGRGFTLQNRFWHGLGRASGASILGTIPTFGLRE